MLFCSLGPNIEPEKSIREETNIEPEKSRNRLLPCQIYLIEIGAVKARCANLSIEHVDKRCCSVFLSFPDYVTNEYLDCAGIGSVDNGFVQRKSTFNDFS